MEVNEPLHHHVGLEDEIGVASAPERDVRVHDGGRGAQIPQLHRSQHRPGEAADQLHNVPQCGVEVGQVEVREVDLRLQGALATELIGEGGGVDYGVDDDVGEALLLGEWNEGLEQLLVDLV